MNNEPEPVCKCRHDFTAHYERSTVCHYCECKQFTDARLAALRAENERLNRAIVRVEGKLSGLEGQLAVCEDEAARLTPRMVRELPTREGWYYRIDGDGLHSIIEAVHPSDPNNKPLIFLETGSERPSMGYEFSVNGWWSAEPITMPEMPINNKEN